MSASAIRPLHPKWDLAYQLNDAMRNYVANTLKSEPPNVGQFELTGSMAESIRNRRREIREDEGGGGICHYVTEWLSDEFSLLRLPVTRVCMARGAEGDVICAAHYVNVLCDGSILDPTADQFGEGHDVRLLLPNDPEYGSYRPEFVEDYTPESSPDLRAWFPFWAGEEDGDAQNKLADQRGEGWWLKDKTALLAYHAEQSTFAQACETRLNHPGGRGR